jgi:plasmid stabilization system protein ParE
MSSLFATEAAHADLDSIFGYLAHDLANPAAARALANAVARQYARLRRHPESCPLCAHPRLAALGYRKALVKNYLFVYRYDASGDQVLILRFFHQSQNYADLL